MSFKMDYNNISYIENLLKSFNWKFLNKMFGSAHNSVIGFISTEWISKSNENFVVDGAPSPKVGGGRTGQKNADLLLCNNHINIPVEVENTIYNYQKKLKAINEYIQNDKKIPFGLMIMGNWNSTLTYTHHWEDIKKIIKEQNIPIGLISIEKKKLSKQHKKIDILSKNDNPYSQFEIVSIDYWIYIDTFVNEGNLWKIN